MSPATAALAAPETIAEYLHTAWTVRDGAPTGVRALAQTRDGFLWVGTEGGLYRFDGVRFERIPGLPSTASGDDAIFALLAARNGDLWIGYFSGRIAILRRGKLIDVSPGNDARWIFQFRESRSGAIWALHGMHTVPLMRYDKGRWTRFRYRGGTSGVSATSFAEAGDGTIWLRQGANILILPPGAGRLRNGGSVKGKAFNNSFGFAADSTGRVWISGVGLGTLRLPEGASGEHAIYGDRAIRSRSPPHRDRSFLFDRYGAIWGVTASAGIFRVAAPQSFYAGGRPEEEIFTAKDGLSSDTTRAILEDREGNIWIGTSAGLDQFRRVNILTEKGVPTLSRLGYAVAATRNGTLYLLDSDSVFRIRPRGRPERVLHGLIPMAVCEANDGTVWIAAYSGFFRSAGDRFQRAQGPPGPHTYFDCTRSRDGKLWFSRTIGGLTRYDKGKWSDSLRGEAGSPVMIWAMVPARDGGVLAYLSSRTLVRIDPPYVHTLWRLPESPDSGITWMYPRGNDVLLVTATGLMRYAGDRITPMPRTYPWLAGITGIVEDTNGYTWIQSRTGILRLSSADLERSFDDRSLTLEPQIFTYADGLPAPPQFGALHNDAMRGGDGRLWFATTDAVVKINPTELLRNQVAPPVKITQLIYGETRLRDPSSVTLPAGVRGVEIQYTGLSLSVPERVRFRYRLEGVDDNWIDPGQRREAFYTNLPPGTYIFRVIAANNDGVWNRKGAALTFVIPPTFLQSLWFKLILGLAAIAALWFAYSVRIRWLRTQLQATMEARLAERERIARELHDTLLQAFQGLVLRFQAAAKRIRSGGPGLDAIEDALQRADRALAEGRDRVREIRIEATEGDIETAWLGIASEFDTVPMASLNVAIEGVPRPLHPMVREEILRIGEEAIRNAFEHAAASRIDASLHYGRRRLRLAVRDDGVGISSEAAPDGMRDGHFGLTGMRERARRIGGVLNIISEEGGGTRVLLSIPARAAYKGQGRRWRLPAPRRFVRSD